VALRPTLSVWFAFVDAAFFDFARIIGAAFRFLRAILKKVFGPLPIS
jgi:hypothetical protein